MLLDEVNKLISRDHINAEWALRRVARKIKHLFDNIPDEYFRERRADVDFVADRVVRNLMGQAVDVEVEGAGLAPLLRPKVRRARCCRMTSRRSACSWQRTWSSKA